MQNYNIFATQPSFIVDKIYLFSPINLYIIDCDNDNIILKNSAVQKELTVKPSTSLSQSKIIKAFITSKNNPKVTMVTGNVNSIITGFTNKLSSPKTMATIMASQTSRT